MFIQMEKQLAKALPWAWGLSLQKQQEADRRRSRGPRARQRVRGEVLLELRPGTMTHVLSKRLLS
jgi:hypothetical protein